LKKKDSVSEDTVAQQGWCAVEDDEIEVGARNLPTEPCDDLPDQCGPIFGSGQEGIVYQNRYVEIAVAAIASACPAPKEEPKPHPSQRR
jgi:hypothetical protein